MLIGLARILLKRSRVMHDGDLYQGKIKAVAQRICTAYRQVNPESPGLKHPEEAIFEELRYIYGEGIQNQINEDILSSGILHNLEMLFHSPEVLEELKSVYRDVLTEWIQTRG